MKKTNKKLVLFFAIAFGMPVLLGICMGIGFYGGQDVSAFPVVWMYLPAAAVMVGTLVAKEDCAGEGAEKIPVPKVFYAVFCAGAIVMAAVTVAGVFVPGFLSMLWVNNLMCITSLASLVLLLAMKPKKREAYGLRLWKNTKKGLAGIGIFVLLYLAITMAAMGIGVLQGVSLEAFSLNPYLVQSVFIIMPLNLLLSFTAFFGEEYGWRYYLMPELQKRLGKKAGVLTVGVLWGLWHLPINLFYYSPSTALQSILVQLAGCIGMGIFFGWVYLRTQNIWAVTMIHFLNNNLGAVLFQVSAQGVERQWGDTLITILLYLAVYLPFLFTAPYREKSDGQVR